MQDHSTHHYHEPTDRAYVAEIRRAAPEVFAAYRAFDDAILRAPERVIPRKYKELMATAVALTTQCAYCIESHVGAARKEGATDEEIAETVFTAAALRAGGAMGHGLMAFKLLDVAEKSAAARE
ncbi:carboxymuconolactone decarboxylase family protein [Aeromicrobium sp. YIM 150415]|uniref:carboxymuconolactone decarboxylase family protein n=1 Tax=Aeromicrobium sp. YIM 150415 TaxID=2803912 RepID=UPI001962902F|nr:carboxymuconolactone decarboxylase family protein [Aeromicrobium sp. YIM 150415]MBM9462427.1 carboxymuconolactone decarboxylase family protein [Aeromicrobium sp. YIM 150415]